MEEKEKKNRAEGKVDDLPDEGGWSRGIVKQPSVKSDAPKKDDGPTMNRNAFGQAKVEERKVVEDSGPKRPTFTRSGPKKESEDGGMLTRSNMGAGKKEEEKKTSMTPT